MMPLDRAGAKKVTSLLVIAALILVICDAVLFRSHHVKTATDATLSWMYYNDAIVLGLHIFLVILSTWFFVPPSLLVLASGFIFQDVYGGCGIAIAWMSSVLGAMIGGTWAYGRAPGISRDLLRVMLDRYPILSVMEKAIVNNPMKVMMLLRLNPLLPFGVLNCVFSKKGVDMALFLVAIVAVMPWYLFLVCVGAGVNSIVYNGFSLIGYGIGVACGAVMMVIAWAIAKDELLIEVGEARRAGRMQRLKEEYILTVTKGASRGRGRGRGRGILKSLSRGRSRSGSKNARSGSRSRSGSRTERTSSTSEHAATVVEQHVDSHIVEYSDLSGADYVRTQILGEDNDPCGGNKDYRNKLDVAATILDDFS